MEKKKKFGKHLVIGLAVLIVCLAVSILLHGFVMCVLDDPFSLEALVEVFPDCEGSEILDQLAYRDSAQVLLQKPDGNIFLLQFQKNALLPKYQMMDVVHIQTSEAATYQSRTVLEFPTRVMDQQIRVDGSASFRFSTFFLLYGLNALLLFAVALMVNHFSLKKRRKNPQEKKSK